MRRGRLIRAAPPSDEQASTAHAGSPLRASHTPLDALGTALARAEPLAAKHAEPSAPLAARLAEASARGRGLSREHGTLVELSRLLAERLVGPLLEQDERALAHFALALIDEARGARSVTLLASPRDAERLRSALAAQDFDERDVRVADDAALADGALRLETELGSVEASAGQSLALLASAARAKLEAQD